MLKRILTAVVLIPFVVALVWWGPVWLLAIFAALVAILALWEFFALGDRHGLRAFRKWTIFCAAVFFYAQFPAGIAIVRPLGFDIAFGRQTAVLRTPLTALPLEFVLLAFVLGAVVIGIATSRPLQDILPALAIGSAGLLFIALPFSFLVRIDGIPRVGRQLVLFTLVLVWAGDMLAYFVGRFLGHIPMAPALSPKKTWEGAIANFAASLIVAGIFAHWIEIDVVTLLFIAGLANVAGQMGDLIESAYKRGAAVKDSGGLLPGHGGMLDRIDSLILAAPVVWVLYYFLDLK
ncbi:MAG: phosphatidate cytidylyltransferase [Candidatus Acidiferrales bacterium]